MSLLRIIATFILIYLVFRLFTYYVLPWILKWYLKRFKRKFYERNPHMRQQEETNGKGKSKVSITYRRSDERNKSLDDVGEYVDFEELDEEKKKQDNKKKDQ